MIPTDDLAGVRRSTARLLETVGRIDDETAARPSLLPGWTVAMLVTHLARNADSHRGMLEGAALGEARNQYPSYEERDAGIEAGRGRSAAEVVDDLQEALARLDGAWTAMPDDAWAFTALTTDGKPNPVRDLPFQRWREVEVHHADLGLGFTVGEWDEGYVLAELEATVGALEPRLPPGVAYSLAATPDVAEWVVPEGGSASVRVEAPARDLLAWLLGRRDEGFPSLGPWAFVIRR